ncbi:MAG: hypothetical protein JW717_06930 [Marinilabiliaceae bacterium]|nr:hypothetical protein [Marinilabiliaceae bacterium]
MNQQNTVRKIRFELKILTLLFLSFLSNFVANAQREIININRNWEFIYGYEVKKDAGQLINLPHTWNNKDALGGNIDYYRGLGIYEKKVMVEDAWKHKRVFIRFLAANEVATVFVNGRCVGEHRGGYTAFAFEITDFLVFGQENLITVKVSNALHLDIIPLVGDFNFYGGIYRDVNLIVTEVDCISLLDHGSEGVYLHQEKVTPQEASVRAVVKLMGNNATEVIIKVKDNTGKDILIESNVVGYEDVSEKEITIPFSISNPYLWQGVEKPQLYKVHVQLMNGSKVLDEVVQPLGLRYFSVDPENGLFLNGKHVQVRGVCRHQDRPELGNALYPVHHEEDISIMRKMGANALRMSHYPHDPYVYDLADKAGLIVWSEIPFVGPGGYRDKGFVDTEKFKQNCRQQLVEMIRQNMNHPSVFFWGLFNELKESGDNPVTFIRELDSLAHAEDPSRLTTCASNQDGSINNNTDLAAWNKYPGWYGGNVSAIADWADRQHIEMPNTPIGISEYGAGAGIYHQNEELKKTDPGSYWHPENWQTHFHEEYWIAINERPFLWGTFIWNLFDFGAAHRTEDQIDGINDKGIVTFDRKVKKDAFYFYQANWNKTDPMVYIAERRNSYKTKANQIIKVYSNQKKVMLWVNGQKYFSSNTDDYSRFYFSVVLKMGENEIIAKSMNGLQDKIKINLRN